MKALLFATHGDHNVLRYTERKDPTGDTDDAIVRVRASALNRIDVIQRSGAYTVPGFQLPHIGGLDIAGEIAYLGSNAAQRTPWQIGDRVVVNPSLSNVSAASTLCNRGDLYGELGVIGINTPGGHAELCVVPASHLHPIPESMPFNTAAVFPTAWMTAHHALFAVGKLQRDETVLIHAAASGVSSAAIQLAKAAGATVLATAGSAEKCAYASSLGADAVTNNRQSDLVSWVHDNSSGRGVNMVFDHVGPALWEMSLFAMAPRARLVSCGNTTGDAAAIPSLGHLFSQGLQILGSDAYRYSEFAPAWTHFCANDFDPCIDEVFQLKDGARAHQRLEHDKALGKLILCP